MPDKVSPAQFAATVKAKYPEYKDVDDLKLTNAMINKYPEYKDKVDFGTTTEPVAPIVQPPVTKYQKAINDDRSEIGKTLSTLYNNTIASLERFGGAIADLPSQFNIAAPGFAPTEIAKTQEQAKAFTQQPISKRLEPAKQLKQKIGKAADVVRSGYTTREEEKAMVGQFNVMDGGIGLKDIQSLIASSGGMALDMGLGAVTGGTSFVLQGYNDAVEDYDAATQKAGIEQSEGARGLYGIAGGVINGLLEKFAVDKLVGDTPVFRNIQKKAIANVLRNTAGMTGKKAVDAIETAAVAEIKKLTSDLRSRGVRAAYRTAVEGGTEAVQAALEDGAKLAANLVQGNEAFNEDEIKKGFLQNIVNSGIAGGIMGPIFGAAADKAFGRNVNTQVLKDISEANTPEQLAAINDELAATFDENNFSQEERDAIMANANRYAQIKQTLPEGTNPIAQTIAIPLIENRIKIDNEIQSRRSAMENFDEALKSDEEYAISVLEDKKSQINDDIREVVNNEKFDYFEKDGKFYKKLGENAPEEISKNRFDLQQLKTEGYATTTGQEQVQEGGTAGDISQRQGTQEGGTQETPPQTDTGYRYIVSEEGSDFPVRALVNKKVRKDGRPAILYQEGQRIVARILGTNRIEDVGNVVEMMDALPQDFGIEVDETVVTETPTGYRVEGEDMVNDSENPLDAISVDQNGNVKNVVLKTPSGKRRKFRGQAAQDLAYQITLKETLKNEDEFELFLEQEHQAELDAAEAKAAAEAATNAANEPVPTVEEPTTEPVTGPTVTTEPEFLSPITRAIPSYGRVTSDNVDGLGKGKGFNKLQNKVLKDVKNVVYAIRNILESQGKEVSVNLHDQDSFEQAVIEAGGSKEDSTSRGFYMDGDGSIHLNMDNLASDTMLHEGFHPILDYLEANDPKVINDFFAQLEAIPGSEEIIAQARENYDDDVTQKKEAITDFVAGVADGRIVLNPSNFRKIRKFLLDMLNKIGIGKGGGIIMEAKDPKGLVELAKLVTENFTEGAAIYKYELLDILAGGKQYDSSDGVDIDEDLPSEGVDRGPQFSKETIEAARKNIKSIASLIGTKISRVVFYDLTRVGPLDIKNIKTEYTPKVEGKGGPFYSYMQQRATDKAVLAFVSINQAIQSLQRQLLYPKGAHAIASQNPKTAHLGNKSTLAALFGDGIGIFQNAATTKEEETEIVNTLVGEIDRISKMPKGEAAKAVKKILKTVDLASIKTLSNFRDKILLGAGDSFGSRGSIFAALLQGKRTKVTAATRDSHKILHYKYGIPTIADIAEGNNQKELSSAELGDVIKLVRPSTDLVIYTTSKEEFDKYSKKPTPEMKKAGIRIELLPESSAHESYPFILGGENVALLENYISAAQLYKKFEKLPKSSTFFKVGRMKKLAEAGEIPKTVTKEEGAPRFQSQKAPTKAITKGKFGGVKKMYKEQVRYGLLGKEGVRLKEKMSGELSAELATAETRVQEAMKTIKKYGGAVTEKDISNFMEGKTSANQLPLDLATQLTEMRAQIDGLTERLIQLGVIDSQESIDYYRENKGKYLLRSYEAINFKENPLIASFTGKGLNIDNVIKKLKNVDQTVVNSALRYLSNRAKAKYIIENALKQNTVKVVDLDKDNYSLVFTSNGQEIAKIPKDSGDTKKEAAVDFMSTYLIDPANIQSYNDIKSTIPNVQLSDDAALEEAKIDANSILDNSESYVMSRGLTGSTNVKSLRQRKDLSPEIRALMGEYTDPLYNYYSTIFKISSLTSSRQYLNSLKEFGMGKFFFDKKTADATKMFAGEASEALKPLNGIYTFPEIYESLKLAEKETTGLISQVAGRIRMFKTVYNPSTHVKNIIGNMGFAVSNGHWTNLPEAYKYMRSAITGKTDEDIMNMMDTLNRYGVLNNVIGIGELKAYFDKNESVDDFLKTIYNNANSSTVASKLGKAKANLSKIPKAIEKAYAIEDDVFKILAFVNESNRYSKALFGVNYNKLSADQKKEIDNIASEIVKDTYPTFSRVPKGVKTLSKVAFIGNFLAFPVESVRTQYNSLRLGVKEIKSGNPKLKSVGYTRLGGAFAYNSIFSALSIFAYDLAGAGLTGAVGMLFGDDEEENETSNAIKKNLAPWNKNSEVYVSKFKDGMLEYYDIGSLDSYGYQRRVWNAFWSTKNKGEFDQMMASGVGELLDPWMTKDFVIDNYMKLSSNDNGRGGTIYNPEGKPMDKFTDMSLYVGKQFGPGALGSAIKIADAYQKGESDKIMDELGAQVFARHYTVDLNKQFQNYIYTEGTDPKKEVGFKYRLQNAEKIYRDAKRQKLSPLELSEKYDEALDAYKEILLTANEYYKAAALGGTNPKLLIESLKKSRIGSAEAIAIITGSFGKYDQAYIRK